jgi:hypothetical protein
MRRKVKAFIHFQTISNLLRQGNLHLRHLKIYFKLKGVIFIEILARKMEENENVAKLEFFFVVSCGTKRFSVSYYFMPYFATFLSSSYASYMAER